MNYRTRVWDLPTRLFHWALLVCVVGLVVTAYAGGNAMVWHFRLGYAVFTLLLFRLVWGLVGGRWSRFATFIYSPRTVLNYVRGLGKPEQSVGHNPLGAGSVFAMLFFLLAQVGTGLISDDDIAFAGPLTKWVSNAQVSLATGYHKNIGQWILAALIALHIVTIVFYLVKKKNNLVGPMIHGDKTLLVAVAPSKDDWRSRLLALAVLAGCAGLVWVVVNL